MKSTNSRCTVHVYGNYRCSNFAAPGETACALHGGRKMLPLERGGPDVPPPSRPAPVRVIQLRNALYRARVRDRAGVEAVARGENSVSNIGPKGIAELQYALEDPSLLAALLTDPTYSTAKGAVRPDGKDMRELQCLAARLGVFSGKPMTYRDIGKRFEVSQERARQLTALGARLFWRFRRAMAKWEPNS